MAIRPSSPVRKLVIIEDGMVAAMASNPDFVKEFPFLNALRNLTPTAGCGSCGGAASTARAQLFGSVKQQIAGMDDGRRRRIKEMLNAAQVQITYKSGHRIIKHTF